MAPQRTLQQDLCGPQLCLPPIAKRISSCWSGGEIDSLPASLGLGDGVVVDGAAGAVDVAVLIAAAAASRLERVVVAAADRALCLLVGAHLNASAAAFVADGVLVDVDGCALAVVARDHCFVS